MKYYNPHYVGKNWGEKPVPISFKFNELSLTPLRLV